MSLLEERFLVGEGFFQDHFHSGVNCYLTAHLAQCYLAAGDPRVWRIVRYLLKHATSTYTWPEAFHPRTKGGCMGEGHHGWAAADWILLLRNLLFVECGENLYITRVLESTALQQGDTFSVHSAPSYFGRISFRLSADRRDVLLELENDFHLSPPKTIHWQLAFTPSKIWIDNQSAPPKKSVIFGNNVTKVLVVR